MACECGRVYGSEVNTSRFTLLRTAIRQCADQNDAVQAEKFMRDTKIRQQLALQDWAAVVAWASQVKGATPVWMTGVRCGHSGCTSWARGADGVASRASRTAAPRTGAAAAAAPMTARCRSLSPDRERRDRQHGPLLRARQREPLQLRWLQQGRAMQNGPLLRVRLNMYNSLTKELALPPRQPSGRPVPAAWCAREQDNSQWRIEVN
jgi:hypothetical protein